MIPMPRLIRLGSARALTQASGGTMHMEENLPFYYDPF